MNDTDLLFLDFLQEAMEYYSLIKGIL